MVLHQVAKAHPLFFRDNGHQVGFDLVRIVFGREAQALRQAHDMGVDADGVAAETVAEDDVGGLAADAGQADEVF